MAEVGLGDHLAEEDDQWSQEERGVVLLAFSQKENEEKCGGRRIGHDAEIGPD
jgi:hypothetical protein